MLSGVVLKMGVYGLVRWLSLLPAPPAAWGSMILALGAVSGLLGVVFAIGQHDLKRLLAYHSVENIGIILMGLGVAMLGRSSGHPEWIALGLAGFSLYPVAMAWGCEEASRDELVTMNQLLLLSYSIGTLAGPSLTSFLMQRYSDNWMPMVIALVALSFMPVLMLGGHGRRKLSR